MATQNVHIIVHTMLRKTLGVNITDCSRVDLNVFIRYDI